MKTKYYVFIGVFIALTLAGCSKDVYDEHALEENQKLTFKENFAKAYPLVNLNQSWDFSTGQDLYSLPSSGAGTRALTRANGYTVTTGDFTLEGSIADYMHTNMKAGKNNKGKGNPFGMKVPENPFTIVPIFQGQATFVWELWMYVETIGDIKVWSKGEDLSYEKDGVWTTFSPGEYEWIPDDGVSQIKSKSYTFSGLPAGKTMYFYLKVTNQNNKIESSLNQMMLTLKGFPNPANVPAEHQATIIGCEDNPRGDWDYEDLVFMVYGKPVPPDYVIKERITENGKRYMMEDLGTTDDFDFNDVVVDVVNRTKEILSYEIDNEGNETYIGVKSRETLPTVARIRAMGGTMDFTLRIGDTEWTKSSKFNAGTMYNTKDINFGAVLDEFEVSGWNSTSNNVSVSVAGKNNNPGQSSGITIKFPKEGEAPLMIAFDTTKEWMTERTGIPENWLKRE